MRWVVVATAVTAAALLLAGAAVAVGPWPGVVNSLSQDGVRYTVSRDSGVTTLRKVANGEVVRSVTFDGSWGIPAVTSNGVAGGLSPDRATLVLAEPPNYNGLRSQSRFLVVATATLTLEKTLTLPGEFGFDAISPASRTLYVIQHASRNDLVSYRVRAYDLQLDRLLSRVIVAQGESTTMRGYPVARATSATGGWVYTLYDRQPGKPFIHALNTSKRIAVCIDLTWQASAEEVWGAHLTLVHGGRSLQVRSAGATVATVDTKTLRVA
jgi:hypothetical protein